MYTIINQSVILTASFAKHRGLMVQKLKALNLPIEHHEMLDEMRSDRPKAAHARAIIEQFYEMATNPRSHFVVVERVDLAFFFDRLLREFNIPEEVLDEYPSLIGAVRTGVEMSNEELEKILAELTGDWTEGYLDKNPDAAPDYCTDWNATMPLAVEHGVSSYAESEMDTECGESIFTGQYRAFAPDVIDGSFYHNSKWFQVIDEDRLRAIVICLIKVLSEGGNG